MPPLDKLYLASRNAAVKCSYAPRFRFSPGLLDWSRTCFTSLFGAVILDEGITCESGPSAFGSVELLSWKYLSKDMTVILTTRWLDAQPPKRHAPKISRRKLSRIAPKPRNPRKFSPSKVFRYTVWYIDFTKMELISLTFCLVLLF